MPLPIQIDKSTPADADNPSAGAAKIRDLKDFLESVFGLTDATNYTAAAFGITTAGIVTVKQNPFSPDSSDGSALGSTSKMWSDLFLAAGAVVNFNNGNATLTHAAGRLDLSVSLGIRGVSYVWPSADGAANAMLQTNGSGTLSWATPASTVGVNNFRLIKSGSNLTLEAVNGNQIDIGGTIYTYTSMPTKAASGNDIEGVGIAASTLYYIYLKDSSGTAVLEFGTTGYTVDSVGRPMRTGDNTRRCVGFVRTTSGSAWADTAAQIFVRSRDNRKAKTGKNFFTADRTTADTTDPPVVEINSEIRVECLVWADEIAEVRVSGRASVDSAGTGLGTAIAFDGTTAEDGEARNHSAGASQQHSIGLSCGKALSEGYHYATILGQVGGGTGTWAGSANANRVTLYLSIGRP